MSDVAAPAPVDSGSNSDVSPNTKAASPRAGGADSLEGKAPAAPTPAEERRHKLKLKVDGNEEEWEGTDADMARELQLSRAARKRMQEAAEKSKSVDSFMERVRKDPMNALKDPSIGVDIKELVKKQLIKEYEDEQLKAQDPREYELREAKAQLEAFKAEKQKAEETAKEAAERQAQEEMDARVRTDLETKFIQAMEQSDLPKDRHTLAEMARVAQVNFAKGLDLTPAEMAQEVKERMDSNAKRYLSNLKGEQLAKRLGDDVVKEVQRYLLQKARGAKAAPVVETKPVLAEPRETQSKRPTRMNQAEMQKLFASKVR